MPIAVADEPWLYEEVHKAASLDELLLATFGLAGLPTAQDKTNQDKLVKLSNIVLGFLAVYVHQFQHALDLSKRRKLSEAQLCAWDLADEAAQELLVACLLVRLRVSAQAVSHMRRSLELVVEGSFLSTSFIPLRSVQWSPFCEIYLTNLWQHYASAGSLTAREVIQAIKAEGSVVSDELSNFTVMYLNKYAKPCCERHLQELIDTHKRKNLSEPIWHDALPETRRCQIKTCTAKATVGVVERVPSFELMREVLKAKLAKVGYSNYENRALQLLYGRTSGFVHVTREAHRHNPEWNEVALQASVDLTNDLAAWLARTIIYLYRWHGLELSGLPEYLEKIRYDFLATPSRQVLKAACHLYSPSEPRDSPP